MDAMEQRFNAQLNIGLERTARQFCADLTALFHHVDAKVARPVGEAAVGPSRPLTLDRSSESVVDVLRVGAARPFEKENGGFDDGLIGGESSVTLQGDPSLGRLRRRSKGSWQCVRRGKLFQFISGLKPWAQTESRRQKVQDLNSAIIAAKALVDWKPLNVSDNKGGKDRSNYVEGRESLERRQVSKVVKSRPETFKRRQLSALLGKSSDDDDSVEKEHEDDVALGLVTRVCAKARGKPLLVDTWPRQRSDMVLRSNATLGKQWDACGATRRLPTVMMLTKQHDECDMTQRLGSGIYDKFASAFSNAVQKLQVGDGFVDGVAQGPLINEAAIQKVEKFVQDAISKGAKVLLGGRRHHLGMTFYEPTVMADINNEMLISREEIFGPVAPILPFKTEEDAIRLANDTNAGLAAYLFTTNIQRSWRVSEALEYGIVGVNEGLVSTEVAPFGGFKQSGIGREGSKYGMDEYVEPEMGIQIVGSS
uniref:Succinate-semialdehyde dehydrogenase, mitochondrial n=1 Tax=Chenopodium quinoa TaxID=63459 RepID=A0A803M7W1_CHEQI